MFVVTLFGSIRRCVEQKNKRPASMFAPASGAKLSTVDGETAKDEDGDKKKDKSQKEDKPQKGLFGMLGKRLSRSTKNLSAAAPLSVPAKSESRLEKTGDEGSDDAVPQRTAAIETQDDTQVAGDQANDYSEIGASAIAAREEMKSGDVAKVTPGDVNNSDTAKADMKNGDSAKVTPEDMGDDGSAKAAEENEEIMNSASVTYATVQKKSASADEPRQIAETTEDGASDRDRSGEREYPGNEIDSKSGEDRRENFADGPADFSDQPADDFFRDDGFVDFDRAAIDESTAFGESASPVSAGFEDGFGDAFSAPAPSQADGFSNEPFGVVGVSPDVALDADESVFDPDTPISPGHFESVGVGGDSDFKADFSQFESSFDVGDNAVRDDDMRSKSENLDSNLAENDEIAFSNSGVPEPSLSTGVSENAGAISKSSEDEFALCYEDTVGVGVKTPDVNSDPRRILSYDASADLNSLPSDDDDDDADKDDLNLVTANRDSLLAAASNAGELNCTGDVIGETDRDVSDDNRVQSDADVILTAGIENEECKEASSDPEMPSVDLDTAPRSSSPHTSRHSSLSDEGRASLEHAAGVADLNMETRYVDMPGLSEGMEVRDSSGWR